MYILWEKNVTGKLWRIIKKLNEDLTSQCKSTNFGISEKFIITSSLRQGGVLSVTEFAKMMDTLNELLMSKNYGVQYGNEKIPSLLLVDDVAILSETKEEMLQMLNELELFRKKCKLGLSKKKSKIMIINKKRSDINTDWKMGDMQIDPVANYTYLGEQIDQNNSLNPHINAKFGKVQGIVNSIKHLTKEQVFVKTRTTVILDLYEKCLIPTILYGCETWSLNNTQMKKLEDMQHKSLCSLLKIPISTPKAALLGETGAQYMETRIHMRQLNYVHKILTQLNNSWRQNMAQIQSETLIENNLMQQYILLLKKYNLLEMSKLVDLNAQQWKNYVKKELQKSENSRWVNEMTEKSKVKDLLTYKRAIYREKYLNLDWLDARTILKARCRMTNLRTNYKNSYSDTLCPRCKNGEDSIKHILEDCTEVEKPKDIQINYSMVLDPQTEPELLRVISNILQKYEIKDKCQRKEPDTNVQKSYSQESGIDAQNLECQDYLYYRSASSESGKHPATMTT